MNLPQVINCSYYFLLPAVCAKYISLCLVLRRFYCLVFVHPSSIYIIIATNILLCIICMNLPQVINCSYYFYCLLYVQYIFHYVLYCVVFIAVEAYGVFVHSSGIYIIIATNILLTVGCVEGFRTTSITMYVFLQGMLYYCRTVRNCKVQNAVWFPLRIRHINVT